MAVQKLERLRAKKLKEFAVMMASGLHALQAAPVKEKGKAEKKRRREFRGTFMLMFPPLPDWAEIHPLIVHFPIALLVVAPLFIVIGSSVKPERSYPFLLAALVLMALATAASFAATSSGEAASERFGSAAGARAVLQQHQEFAETTELAFVALTLIYASILFAPRAFNIPPGRATSTVLPLIFLVLYATGTILLANTAHHGGRLAHEPGLRYGIQAGSAVIERPVEVP